MSQATFGQLLARADADFEKNGGYRADAWCEQERVDLVRRDQNGRETIISSAEMPRGVAPEDVAVKLLAEQIGREATEKAYLVVTFH